MGVFRPLLIASAALIACGHTEATVAPVEAAPSAAAPEPQSAQPEPNNPQPEPSIASHMQTTFAKAVEVRDAIVAGDLARAQSAAAGLDRSDYYETLPQDWTPWIRRVRRHASEVVDARDLESAAMGLSAMALSCGNCHWYVKRGPRSEPTAQLGRAEPGAPEVVTRMRRHRVATDQLWLGLIAPSDGAWKEGAATIIDGDLAPPTRDGEPLSDYLTTEIYGTRADALKAREAPTHEGRAERYGKLLTRCGRCHQYVRR